MEFHIGTKINILTKSKIILESVTELRNESESYKGYSPDINVSAVVNPEDIIGDIEMSRTKDEDVIAKWFVCDGKYWGFSEDKYKILRKLAEEIQKHKIYRDKISLIFVEDIIFNWVKEKYQKKIEVDLIDYFEMKCREILREYEIWIPIFGLHIEVEITIGKIILKTITRHMLDEWIEQKRELIPIEQFEVYSQKTRKNVQGFAAAVVKVWAEPIRAFDVAYELTEEALAVLRVFSPCNFSPKAVCYCIPLGKQKVEEYKYFHVHDGRIVCKTSGFLNDAYQPWVLNRQMIETLKGYGLNIVGEVLQKEEKTKFQEVVLNSLIMYAKSCL